MEKDLRETHCCGHFCHLGDTRQQCGGEAKHETCGGFERALWNLPSAPHSLGMTCQCSSGYCYDASTGGCVADAHAEARQANTTQEVQNALRRQKARALLEDIQKHREHMWEASVVKTTNPHFSWHEGSMLRG